MAHRQTIAERNEIVERLETAQRRGRILLIRSRWLVHDRADDESRVCPCGCGSRTARLAFEQPDLELLVDRVAQVRKLRHVTDEGRPRDAAGLAAFDREAALAELVDLPFRVSRAQYDMITEAESRPRKIIVASGGSRSSKTQAGAVWLLRRILLRGGRGRVFAIMAPTEGQAFRALEKWIHGSTLPYAAPILPVDAEGEHLLAVRWPSSARASDLAIHLIDGTRIELLHAASVSGKQNKGLNLVDLLADEAAEFPSVEAWNVAVGRLAGTRGCCWAATTAKEPDHWLKVNVLDHAEVIEEEDGSRRGDPEIFARGLAKMDNVFYSREAIEADLATYKDEQTRRREAFGEWVSVHGVPLWVEFERDRHMRYLSVWDVAELGCQTITDRFVRAHFRRKDNPYVLGRRAEVTRWIGGADVNVEPQTTLIGQIELLDEGRPDDPRSWRLWIVDEIVTHRCVGTAYRHAEYVQSDTRAASLQGLARSPYRGLAVFIDPQGCYTDPTARNAKAIRSEATPTPKSAAAVMSEAGLDVRSPWFSKPNVPASPRIRDRVALVQELFRTDRLYIASRCTSLLKSLEQQQNDGTGKPVKESGYATDRLSSAADALGYLAWGIYQQKLLSSGGIIGGLVSAE